MRDLSKACIDTQHQGKLELTNTVLSSDLSATYFLPATSVAANAAKSACLVALNLEVPSRARAATRTKFRSPRRRTLHHSQRFQPL
ncbi:hypothetical protein [Chamaesiphon sp.]|uniref:hypothetical protein n=1 Tax=Chamaesiphon sp. TaxID=2814140 RepID=UPI0035937CAA